MNNTAKSFKLHTDLKIRLIPHSSKNKILRKEGDTYKIKIISPPVDGRANRALISLLSKKLKVPKRNMDIIRGVKSRNKTVRVYGFSRKELETRMESLLPDI